MFQVQQLGPPYGNCSADKPDYKEENCMAEWDYRLFLKQCGCITMDAKLGRFLGSEQDVRTHESSFYYFHLMRHTL